MRSRRSREEEAARDVVLLDTGPLVALFAPDDRNNARARSRAAALGTTRLVTCEAVVTEASYLLYRPDRRAQMLLWLDAADIEVRALAPGERASVRALTLRYADLPTDYADAVLVQLATAARITRIWTYDRRDFSVYRVRGRPLRIVD